MIPVATSHPTRQVGDNEAFFTTMHRGRVGILSIDALKLDASSLKRSGDQGGEGGVGDAKKEEAGCSEGFRGREGKLGESPLLGSSQWAMLDSVLDTKVIWGSIHLVCT